MGGRRTEGLLAELVPAVVLRDHPAVEDGEDEGRRGTCARLDERNGTH